MQRKILTMLSFLLLLSCSGGKTSSTKKLMTEDPTIADEKIMHDYSAEQLGQALNIMRVVLDRSSGKPDSEFCGLDSMQASLMSQQIRFMLEEKLDNYSRPKNPPAEWRQCKSTCNCYLYSRIYGDENEYFLKMQKETTSVEAYQCAKKSGWFCGSPLHQYLDSLSSIGEANY